MAASAPITIDKLFEYVIAAILRASGYVAGVPIRRIGGRGTTHQIDIIGIEFTHLPFLYDTILLVEAKCYDPNEAVGIDIVRQVKSNIVDLEQTLPRYLNILPRSLNPVDYFVRIFGRRTGEGLTVCYRGAIFTTGQYSRYAREFAYAHGIYLFNFPPTIYGKKVIDWIKILRDILMDLADDPNRIQIYLPRIRKKTWIDYYSTILNKLREHYGGLEPEERHYLFSLIRGILRRHEDLERFWKEIRKICLVGLNGYPALAYLSERRSIYLTRKVLEHYAVGAEKKSRRRIYGSRAEISDLKLTREWSEPLGEDLYQVAFLVSDEEKKPVLKGRLFVQRFLHKFFEMEEMTLILPITEGLNLVAKSSRKTKKRSNDVKVIFS